MDLTKSSPNSKSVSEKKNKGKQQKDKLSLEIFKQIKDFPPYYSYENGEWEENKNLSSEQKSLINKLIVDEELRERYKMYGLCDECWQPNTNMYKWCKPCNTKHFKDNFPNWTSGNPEIDEFIRKYQSEVTGWTGVLEWVPYDQFTDIKKIGEGAFGEVYKAKWIDGVIGVWSTENNTWKRDKVDNMVVLKVLKKSENITVDFLREITSQKQAENGSYIVKLWGISQDPITKNYVMVMKYIPDGNLRQHLNANNKDLCFKTLQLYFIAAGLNSVHGQGLMHRDLHSGNILNLNGNKDEDFFCYIADFGLCRPVNEADKSKVYGVMPYVAPEVLQGQPYTQASDVYSFGMIMYEVLTGLPPFYSEEHGINLALSICWGVRPQFPEKVKYPQILIDLIKQCWNSDPAKRPSSRELDKTLKDWWWKVQRKENTDFYQQYREAEEFNQRLPDDIRFPSYEKHPKAIYTSRLLPTTKEMIKLLQKPEEAKILQSVEFNLDKLDDWLEENEGLDEFVNIFSRIPEVETELVEKVNIDDNEKEQVEQQLQTQVEMPVKK
ncbi:putative Non-specific protein-tyrosine kinase [endosymbiont DhMRE of Dentiscutata heterogama]|uniref:protein kinase domain-containing protein n=1 Tax=endosymbiont DhMRE of Dentiscutata heterogama TaxID=1609546 RepID=UPI000629D6F6|nr:protein kinase [endosymbiont DhMRE of Dentiscutata heterogama]CFW93425.1 putative Non-specific protein-tyrosine kinase [endosymbiont DhMRE of Dentiscutata heterogama]